MFALGASIGSAATSGRGRIDTHWHHSSKSCTGIVSNRPYPQGVSLESPRNAFGQTSRVCERRTAPHRKHRKNDLVDADVNPSSVADASGGRRPADVRLDSHDEQHPNCSFSSLLRAAKRSEPWFRVICDHLTGSCFPAGFEHLVGWALLYRRSSNIRCTLSS